MPSTLIRALTALLVIFVSSQALADTAQPPADGSSDGRAAVGLRIGTLGFGLEGVYRINPNLDVRAGFNTGTYDRDFEPSDQDGVPENDLTYNGEIDLQTIMLMADWRPLAGVFRVSGGLTVNGNKFGVSARCNQAECEIDGDTYTREEIGTLTGELDWGSTVPYIGIGWSNPFPSAGRVGLALDIGAVLQGSGDVDLRSDSPMCDLECQVAIASVENEIQNDADEFDVYPVISLGLTFKF